MASSPSLSYSFKGARVLVTGGGRGIGYSTVKKFYNDGANVFVIDKDAQLLGNLKKELPNVTTICVDLLNWDETKKAVEALAPLDHLVNNAGIVAEQELMSLTPDVFDRVMGVNVKAPINVSQAFVKGILSNKTSGGTIVTISSITDRVALYGAAAYGCSKAAVTLLTKTMALEFGQLHNGIRVNCVNPTFIETELVKAIDPAIITQPSTLALRDRTILKGRKVETSDIADTVLFLSSPLSSMITGESILVDAGLCSV